LSDAVAITTPVAERPLRPRYGRAWRFGLAAAAALAATLAATLGAAALVGVGVWGVNIPFVWGLDLTSYAWWIGVANGASLFAAILVLRRHSLRTAVNRFAEAAALAAVLCAALFPIFHLGRPDLFWWMLPYPATFQVWPQFRSTLVWDFWGITTHAVVTGLLWYVGLVPDLATMRDRARTLFGRRVYGVLALGWRGSIVHWSAHQAAHRTVALLVLPLLVVMQSTVTLEFATTIAPGWHDARWPVHFVVTGLLQGLAAVLMLAVLLRWGLGLERHIDDEDVDLLGRLVAAGALASGYVFLDEVATAALGEPAAIAAAMNRIAGDGAPLFWAGAALVVLPPLALLRRSMRFSVAVTVTVAACVAAGVYLDRYSLVVDVLARTRLPAMWRGYAPTLVEAGLVAGTLGLFAVLLLLFARFVPAVAMYEERHDENEDAP
jgi:molybdopterin-containing oxidoreductase family membrane subunit